MAKWMVHAAYLTMSVGTQPKSLLRCQNLGKLLQILKGILFTGHGVDDCFETGKPFCAAPDQFWNWQLACSGSLLSQNLYSGWPHLENLEMSGNFTAVRKMSGNWGSKSGIVGAGESCPVNSLLLSSGLWLQQCLVDWSELLYRPAY